MIVSRSSRSIDEQESIGHYEFASYPRSLFQGDTLLSCTDKSEVGRALHVESQNAFHMMTNTIDPSTDDESVEGWSSENDSASQESPDSDDFQRDCMQDLLMIAREDRDTPMDMDEDNQPHSELVSSFEPSHKCIIIDGMAVLHLIPDSTKMQTISDLSRMFNAKIEDKMDHYDEIRLVFDPYTDESRKQATRAKRQKGAGTYYAVSASTNLAVIGMKQFLSHERTKQELLHI